VATLCAVLFSGLISASVAVTQDGHPAPWFDARTYTTEYVGPGREVPPPEGLTEVRIAWFGPADENHPDWGDAWRGATIAIEEANAGGGYQGLPFRLLGAWSDSPWGSGVADLARLILGQDVWAVVGGVDGTTTHLAEQIVAKAHLALVSPGNTDKSVNLTNVPWAFTCLPTDDAQAEAIGTAMISALGSGPFATLAATDHDARAALGAFRAFLSRSQRSPILHVDVEASTVAVAEAAARIARTPAQAVLLIAPALQAARLTAALRQAGFAGRIYGGATLARRSFIAQAGSAAQGAVVPLLYEPSPGWDAFAATFERRFGVAPDFLAGQTYDAVRLTVDAIRTAGLNRTRILDALRVASPWKGVAGTLAWDRTGRNTRPVRLATVRDGRLVSADSD
jgi:branched-chain amino acid transport system substrate-binding protein